LKPIAHFQLSELLFAKLMSSSKGPTTMTDAPFSLVPDGKRHTGFSTGGTNC